MIASPPRILVVRRRYLGDLVLLGSFFRNLRLHWPQASITALVEAPYAGALALIPEVDRTLVFPRSAGGWLRLPRLLRAAGFSHVFDFDNTDKTALVTRFTGAPFRAALHLENVRRHFPSFYTATSFVPSSAYSARSITETYLQLLVPAGIPVLTREVRLVPAEADLAFVRGLLTAKLSPPGASEPTTHNTKPKTVLVHPGSRSAFRLWPPEHFGRICRRLREELGARVALISGPGEAGVVRQILPHTGGGQAVIDQPLSVPQFAALASLVDLLLCHDSGPMHIAAAVGTRVVALYGSQNATVWRPPGDRHTILQPPLPCQNCVAPGRCVPGDSYRNYCIQNLGEDQVFAAVRDQLARS